MSKDEKISKLSTITIERVAFGVRFQPRYELLDNLGGVVDRVLRLNGSPFGPTTFPLSRREPGEHILLNLDTGDQLRITASDVVIEMQVNTKKQSEIQNLSNNFAMFVLDNLRENAHLKDIVRYGVIFKLEECRSSLIETPVMHFLEKDYKDARSLSLRFTRRLPSFDSLVKRVDDYRNVIYTVKQTEEGEVKIGVDYQEYFKPELNSKEWAQKPFVDFVNRGINYFIDEFQDWLIKLSGKFEAA